MRDWEICIMTSTYEDDILGAPDVCANCLSVIRVERIDPFHSSPSLDDLDTQYERNRATTEVGYGPSEEPAHAKGTFCTCGVEGARDRIWSAGELSDARFKDLVKNLIRTAQFKGLTIDARTVASVALQGRRDGMDPDQALATALDAGLTAAAATDDPGETGEVSASTRTA